LLPPPQSAGDAHVEPPSVPPLLLPELEPEPEPELEPLLLPELEPLLLLPELEPLPLLPELEPLLLLPELEPLPLLPEPEPPLLEPELPLPELELPPEDPPPLEQAATMTTAARADAIERILFMHHEIGCRASPAMDECVWRPSGDGDSARSHRSNSAGFGPKTAKITKDVPLWIAVFRL
jgi:hypothetical protein